MHANNFQDLTGMHFGYYEVIGEAPSRIQPNGKIVTMWYCKCVCGTVKSVAGNHLKSRPNISCGCMKKTTLEDLTGTIIDYLLVNNRAPDVPKGNGKMRTMWNCTCLACGQDVVMAASHLKKQGSCGCVGIKRNQIRRTNDFTGKTVGRLFVIERLEDYVKPSGGSDRRWKCRCECGNECIKTSQYLQRSPTPSCGCWKEEITSDLKFKDLSGQTVGLLYVVKRVSDKITSGGNKVPCFLCRCACGNEIIVRGGNLRSGITRSCGCLKSEGEFKVKQWLREHKIIFETELFYDDLISPNGGLLRFDFAIYDDPFEKPLFLIEYQGEQHYKDCGEFGKFEREITDQMKKDYCKAHNIILHEIRYDEDVSERLKEICNTCQLRAKL